AAAALVSALADRVRSVLDPDVPVARFGAHSLAELVQCNHSITRCVAGALRDAIATHLFCVHARSDAVTASIGRVHLGGQIASVPQILSKGSHCLNAALEMGGNTVQVFDPGAADRAEEERIARWVDRLREALAGNGFVPHYLPVQGLQGDGGELYEVHLRIDGDGELVQPSACTAIAEEHVLLGEIDRWVVRQAIATLAERHR